MRFCYVWRMRLEGRATRPGKWSSTCCCLRDKIFLFLFKYIDFGQFFSCTCFESQQMCDAVQRADIGHIVLRHVDVTKVDVSWQQTDVCYFSAATRTGLSLQAWRQASHIQYPLVTYIQPNIGMSQPFADRGQQWQTFCCNFLCKRLLWYWLEHSILQIL